MQHERRDLDDDDLAEIWRSAQRRRTEDLHSWFTHTFRIRRQLKSPDARPRDDGVRLRSLTLLARTLLGSEKIGRIRGGRSGQ
jgi:hypothetical protein